MLEIKNALVLLVVFLKHGGLCGRLADSNYIEELIPCTNFRVSVTPFACKLRAQS